MYTKRVSSAILRFINEYTYKFIYIHIYIYIYINIYIYMTGMMNMTSIRYL